MIFAAITEERQHEDSSANEFAGENRITSAIEIAEKSYFVFGVIVRELLSHNDNDPEHIRLL